MRRHILVKGEIMKTQVCLGSGFVGLVVWHLRKRGAA